MITYKSLAWLGEETIKNSPYFDLLDEVLCVQIQAFHKIFNISSTSNLELFLSITSKLSNSKSQQMFRNWIISDGITEMVKLYKMDLDLNISLASYLNSMRTNTKVFMLDDQINDLRANVMSSLNKPTEYLNVINNRTKKPFF